MMIKQLGVLLLCVFFISSVQSQIDSSEVNRSPYGVIYNHLYYLQDDSYDVEKSTISFPEELENAEELSIKLKRILDGKGLYIDINRLPEKTNYRDTLTNENIYFIGHHNSKIYVEKRGDSWFYSRTTIEEIPALYKEVFPLGEGLWKYFSGPAFQYELFGVSVVKWVSFLLLLVLCGLAFYFINLLSKFIVFRFLEKRLGVPGNTRNAVEKLARVFGLFLASRLLLYFIPMFQFPVRFNSILIKAVGILSIFFLILIVVRIAGIIFQYLERVTRRTKNTLDDQLLPVVSRMVNIIIWVLGIIYILDYLNINITALLAGISIGGLALALAAQDTVKNFFGSIMIFVDRPFQIGDWIHFDDVDGTVEEVGLRSTRIRTFANSVVYVPNGMLANKVVNNMGLRKYRRFKTELGVMYSTPPDRIDLFVKGIREIIMKHPTTRKDYFEVHLNSFGPSSMNVLLYCFFEAPDWTSELEGRHDIIYAILTLADEIGVSFAFPSQSIYLENMNPNTSEKSNQHIKEYNSSMNKIEGYFKESESNRRKDKFKPLGGE